MVSEEQNVEPVARVSPLAWCIIGILILCQAIACVAGRKPSLDGQIDLRAFYAAGSIVRTGHGAQLYNYDYQNRIQNALVSPRASALPFLYPSFAALPFVPLSLLSYRAAFFIVLCANLGLLLLAAFLLRPWLPYFNELSPATLPALYCCLFGVSMALMQGQLSFALLAIYCGTWVLLQKKNPLAAGVLMSLGVAKFQIAIPIFILFLAWRQWRFALGFIVGGGVLAAISASMVGNAGVLTYVHSMAGMTKQTALNAAAAKVHYGMFPSDMPNLHGLAFGLTHGAHWGLTLSVILSAVAVVFAARQRPSLLVALPAAMLVSYHMQPHDLTLLLLPLSFEVDYILRWGKIIQFAAIGFYEAILIGTLLLLILPLAAVLMMSHMNYLVSFAVCGVMLLATQVDIGAGSIGLHRSQGIV